MATFYGYLLRNRGNDTPAGRTAEIVDLLVENGLRAHEVMLFTEWDVWFAPFYLLLDEKEVYSDFLKAFLEYRALNNARLIGHPFDDTRPWNPEPEATERAVQMGLWI